MEYRVPKNYSLYFSHKDIFKDGDIIKVFVERDYDIEFHQQEFYEINIVTKGTGTHFIGNNRVEVRIGDVFIVPPNVVHGYVGGEDFDVYHILINDNFMRKYLTDLQEIPNFFTLFAVEPIMRATTQQPFYLSLNKEQFTDIKKILYELLKYEDLHDSISNLSRIGLALYFICSICKIYTENQQTFDDLNINYDVSFMNSISYIHENFNKKITIEELCEIALLSRSTYIRKFKKICKMPPSDYIFKCKMDSAKNLLINTSFSISAIAEKTGFYDSAHLTRTFESEIGTTPSAFRKQNKI